MKGWGIPFLASIFVFFTLGNFPPLLWANSPNIVLSQAIQFSTPSGDPVTLSPGKYNIEQAGPTELRVTSERDNQSLIIQAEAFTHEQYELFSPMALTRPKKNDVFSIELYLPGGIRLAARGSSKPLSMAQQPTPPAALSTPSKKVTKQPHERQIPAAVIPKPTPPEMANKPVRVEPAPKPQGQPFKPSPPEMANRPIRVEPAPRPQTQPPEPSLAHLIPYRALSPDQPGLRIDAYNGTDGKLPTILVLAPNHIGLTSQKHPILYWYLSRPTAEPLDVKISDVTNLDVLLDVRLLPPLPAGIHKIRLEDYGISLVPRVSYRWTVRLMNSQATGNLTASGVIQRISQPPSPSSLFASSNLTYSPEAYARKGLWYDAFSALSGLLQGNPGNSEIMAQRASLLDQVGLSEITDVVRNSSTP